MTDTFVARQPRGAGGPALGLAQVWAATEIDKEDGSKAVGKTWAEKGTAQPGAANMVREEDMPRNFRIIPPKKGVAGITHDFSTRAALLAAHGDRLGAVEHLAPIGVE